MKFVIVLACLLAVAYANDEHHDIHVIHEDSDVDAKSFHYNYELDNHHKQEQQGELKEDHDWVVHGEYEYVSKDGKHHKVSYVADEHGYQPKIELI